MRAADCAFPPSRYRALFVVLTGRNGRPLPTDPISPKALGIDVDQGIKGEQVVEAMTRIALSRGALTRIRVDNGPEFISKALDRWAYENGVTLDFSRPGKPTDNPVLSLSKGAHTT